MATAAYSLPTRFQIPHAHTARHARVLRASVQESLQNGDRHLVFDCAAWSEIDVSMLSSLIRCAAACRDHGVQFEVENVSREMRERVRALGLNERLGIHD